MLAYATDGREHHRYYSEALLRLAVEFSNAMVYTLMSRESNFADDLPVRILRGTAGIFDILFEDGNMGAYYSAQWHPNWNVS